MKPKHPQVGEGTFWCPVLVEGPYHIHVLTLDGPLPAELRFPAEPLLDLYGKPSVCAPRPTSDGPVVYAYTGFANVFGCPIYQHKENRQP